MYIYPCHIDEYPFLLSSNVPNAPRKPYVILIFEIDIANPDPYENTVWTTIFTLSFQKVPENEYFAEKIDNVGRLKETKSFHVKLTNICNNELEMSKLLFSWIFCSILRKNCHIFYLKQDNFKLFDYFFAKQGLNFKKDIQSCLNLKLPKNSAPSQFLKMTFFRSSFLFYPWWHFC
jgi:hypothetical protein